MTPAAAAAYAAFGLLVGAYGTLVGAGGGFLVVAGATGMAGAAYLASKGALRAGAGLVTCACPETIWPSLSAKFICVMTAPLPATPEGGLAAAGLPRLRERLREASALCLGPGLGRATDTVQLVRTLLQEVKIPTVIDADGLMALGGRLDALAALKGLAVLTPHPGEMAALTGSTVSEVQADRKGAAKRLAERLGVVVVLKGHGTIVTDGRRVAVNDTGNPGMATAGAGDVLAGAVAGLLAQGMAPFEAAYLGVHLHGLAGDLAAVDLGLHGLIATDILEALPRAFRKHAAR